MSDHDDAVIRLVRDGLEKQRRDLAIINNAIDQISMEFEENTRRKDEAEKLIKVYEEILHDLGAAPTKMVPSLFDMAPAQKKEHLSMMHGVAHTTRTLYRVHEDAHNRGDCDHDHEDDSEDYETEEDDE